MNMGVGVGVDVGARVVCCGLTVMQAAASRDTVITTQAYRRLFSWRISVL